MIYKSKTLNSISELLKAFHQYSFFTTLKVTTAVPVCIERLPIKKLLTQKFSETSLYLPFRKNIISNFIISKYLTFSENIKSLYNVKISHNILCWVNLSSYLQIYTKHRINVLEKATCKIALERSATNIC